MTDLSRLIIIIDSGNDPPAPAGQHRHIGSIHTMDENKMEYGADLLTLLDEDGNEHQFEVADTMEYEGEEYMALVPVFDDPEDLLEGTGAGCGELLEMILRETEYDHVILDLGSFSGASAELMELCDIIYMPILKDRVSQGKVESFTAYLEGAGRNRILEGLRKVELSEPCLPRPGENYLEGLLLSPLGDQVRGLSL